MKNRTIPSIATLCLLSAATAPAQTGSSPYEPSITSMQFETIVPLGAISGANILFLNAPDALSALQSGQLEMHKSSTYGCASSNWPQILCNLLKRLVAGEGFEPSTFGL